MEDVNQGSLNSGAEGRGEEGKGVHLNMFIKTTQLYEADRLATTLRK